MAGPLSASHCCEAGHSANFASGPLGGRGASLSAIFVGALLGVRSRPGGIAAEPDRAQNQLKQSSSVRCQRRLQAVIRRLASGGVCMTGALALSD